MSKVLVINASIMQDDKSISFKLAKRFIEHYKNINPNDDIIWLNLNKEKVANMSLNADNITTFYTEVGSADYIKQLKSVDKVVVSCPMTNFNYTAALKNYIDAISVANETFSYKYSKKGDAIGLLNNLTVQVLTTQGAPYGWYLWGNHTQNLVGTWEFLGAKVVEPLLLAGTKVEPFSIMSHEEIIDSWDEKIKLAAKNFK